MKNNKPYRHGDVLIVPAELPKEAVETNSLVLAEGEATGHRHEVQGAAKMFKWNERTYLKVTKQAKITHQEHGLQLLKPGTYEIKIRKTWSETGWKKVVD